MRTMFVLVSVLALVATGGCGKKDDGEGSGEGGGGEAKAACAPLTVTVDGTPLEAELGNGLGLKEPSTGGYVIYNFNHDKATCEQILASSRQVPEGEVQVRAMAGPGMTAVGMGSYTQIGVAAKLVTEPKKEGDKVAACLDKVEFSPNMGANKGKKVVVNGLVEGTYCGARK